MRASASLYQCSGCSVVFADPKAWRGGEAEAPPVPSPMPRPIAPYSLEQWRIDHGTAPKR
jgi:hypothetical protein